MGAMHRRVTDLRPPVEALTRMYGDSASRSTETIRPAEPIPMMGADSLVAAIISRIFPTFAGLIGFGIVRLVKAPVDKAIGWGSIAALSFMTLCIALLDGVIMPLTT